MKMHHSHVRARLAFTLFLLVIDFVSYSQTFTITQVNPSDQGKSDGRIIIHGFLANTNYTVSYNRNDTPVTNVAITSDLNGFVVIKDLPGATFTDFSVKDSASKTQNIASTVLLVPGAIATQATKFFGAVYGNFTGIQDDDPASFWQVYARLSQPLNAYKGIPIASSAPERTIFLRNFTVQLTYANTGSFKTYSVDTLGNHYSNRLDLLAHAYFNGNVTLNILTFILPKFWTKPKPTLDMAHLYFDIFSSYLATNVIDTFTKNDPATLKTYSVKTGMYGINLKAAFASPQWNVDASCKIFKLIPWSSTIDGDLNPQTSDYPGSSLPQNSKKEVIRSGNPAYAQFEFMVQYNTGDVPDNSAGKEAGSVSNSNAFIRFVSTTNFAGTSSKNYPNNYWQIQLGYALDISKILHGQAAPAGTQ